MAEKMISKEDFQKSLKAWGDSAKMEMQRVIKAHTHGKGELAKSIKVSVKESNKDNSHSVGFNFHRYGVYVAYGVGRGWIRVGSSVVRGNRVKKGSEIYNQLLSKGYAKKDIKSYALVEREGKERKPVDWFDAVLGRRLEELGEIASSYYADFSMKSLLDVFDRSTISSNAKIKLHGGQ